MNVTEWKPTEGCSACKQAEKIMGKMTHISMQGHGLAKNKIMELEQQKTELLEALEDYLLQDEIAQGYGAGIGGEVQDNARAAINKARGE